MLIKCPECGKEISDKAEVCIQCGYPIKEYMVKNKYEIAAKQQCPKCNSVDWEIRESSGRMFCNKCAKEVIIDQEQYNFHFKKINEQKQQQATLDSNKPHCPKCNSTNIQMVPRKWSLFSGFMTNKIDRVCANCKHKW